MENMKFRIDSPAQSEALQSVLFSLGYVWTDGDKQTAETNAKHIFAYADNMTFAHNYSDTGYFEQHGNKEQLTAEFIAKHTKKENMNNSSSEAESTFDINADISRQYTRDGRKVIHIHDTGFDITYPISAVVEGSDQPFAYTNDGQYYVGRVGCMRDIVTRPEIKPLIVDYLNVYSTGGTVGEHSSASVAVSAAGGDRRHLAVIKLTYNPNDNSVSAEIASE